MFLLKSKVLNIIFLLKSKVLNITFLLKSKVLNVLVSQVVFAVPDFDSVTQKLSDSVYF